MPDIAKINGVAYGDVAKVNGVAWADIQYINGMLNPDNQPTLPTGIIVPYTAGAGGAPAGWTLYDSADGFFIIGAGDTYAVDDTGAGTGAVAKTVPAVAGHTGSLHSCSEGNGDGGSSSAGGHSHTATYTWAPPYQNIYLIKADAGQALFPQDSCIFSHQGDLTTGGANIYTTADRMLKANAAVTAGGSMAASCTSTSAGSHDHGNVSGGSSTGKDTKDILTAAGAHTHAIGLTMTNDMYRHQLSCWSNAAGTMTFPVGVMALYENTTPPVGWALCDGNNGTVDMRNKFCEFIDDGNEASPAGQDGNVTAVGTTEAHGNHNHANGNDTSAAGENAYHVDNTTHPTHAAINENYAWLAPYYALAWIMYTG